MHTLTLLIQSSFKSSEHIKYLFLFFDENESLEFAGGARSFGIFNLPPKSGEIFWTFFCLNTSYLSRIVS